jgi:hypothetical protein
MDFWLLGGLGVNMNAPQNSSVKKLGCKKKAEPQPMKLKRQMG